MTSQKPAPSLLGFILLASSLALALIPISFADLNPLASLINRVALGLGFLAVAGAAIRMARGQIRVLACLSLLAVLAVIAAITTGDFLRAMNFVLPLAVGVCAGWVLRERVGRAAFWLLVLVTASLVADAIFGVNEVLGWFGTPLRATYIDADFRARGIVGQPLPAAMIPVYLAFVWGLATLANGRVHGPLKRGVVFACLLFTLLATGTRSAAVILMLGLVLALMAKLVRGRLEGGSGTRLGWLWVSAVLGVMAYPQISSALSDSRVFDFAGLEGTESLTARLGATTVFSTWTDTCDTVCKVGGAGPRALQESLPTSITFGNLSTVDNFFMTVLWDFGLVGLALLLAVLVFAMRQSLGQNTSPISRAASVGLVLIILSAVFYDALYVRSVAVLFGILLGVALSPDREAAEVAEGVQLLGRKGLRSR